MVQLPALARLIYVALWTAADDHGYLRDETARLAMEVMPQEDFLEFDDWFQFFVEAGRIEYFLARNGETFFRIAKWHEHQKVDRPSASKIFREDSRSIARSSELSHNLAVHFGCPPGGQIEAFCHHCGAAGLIHWHKTKKGHLTRWITFPGLEIDCIESPVDKSEKSSYDVVLSCANCNRNKGKKSWLNAGFLINNGESSRTFASTRDPSCTDQGSGIRDQGSGIREGGDSPGSDSRGLAIEKPIEDTWQPSERVVEALTSTVYGSIPLQFVAEQAAEFVVWWKAAGRPAISFDSKFMQRCKKQWIAEGHLWKPKPSPEGGQSHETHRGYASGTDERARVAAATHNADIASDF